MFGDYLRAGLIWIGAAFLDTLLKAIGDELLAVADCSLAPVSTQICTYGQAVIDYFLLAVTLSLIVLLVFRAWRENRAAGI